MSKKQNFIMGAAVAVGLIGTLATLFVPKKSRSWTDQTKTIADSLVAQREDTRKNWVLGSIAGGLIGMTTALLFAPKSGKNLMKDLVEPFHYKKEVKDIVAKARKKIARKAKANVHARSTHHAQSLSHIHPEATGAKTKKSSSSRKKIKKEQ